MKIYAVIDRGDRIEYKVLRVKDVASLRRLGSVKVYGIDEILKDVRKQLVILTEFGSDAYREIIMKKAMYVEIDARKPIAV